MIEIMIPSMMGPKELVPDQKIQYFQTVLTTFVLGTGHAEYIHIKVEYLSKCKGNI